MRPRSFPRHFDRPLHLGLFYYVQKNLWNIKALWSTTIGGYDEMSRLQSRIVGILVNYFSAHSIDNDVFEPVSHVFLPTNTTYALQPVDCAARQSFKCAYRSLTVSHILRKVNRALEIEDSERVTYNLTDILTSYYTLCMLREAWYLVPKRVTLKACLKNNILFPLSGRM